MPSAVMLYVLAVPAWDPGVGERIEAFRRSHEPERAAIVPAHVTLVFGVQRINADDLVAHVGAVAQHTAPFRVTFSAVENHHDLIEGGYKLFLMEDAGDSNLSRLHGDLYGGPLRFERCTDIHYRPHMTVATAQSLESIQSALADVPVLGLPLSGTVEGLRICLRQQHEIMAIANLPLAAH